jgi:AraC-like DNA-binding protein
MAIRRKTTTQSIHAVLAFAQQAGVHTRALADAAGADVDVPEWGWVDEERLEALLQELSRALHNENVGLDVGLSRAGFGLFHSGGQASPNLAGALHSLVHWFGLLHTHGHAVFSPQESGAGVLRLYGLPAPLLHSSDFAVSTIVSGLRGALLAPWNPLRVELRRPAPTDPQGYAHKLGCPVVFGARGDALLLAPDDAARATRHTDPGLRLALTRYADQLMAARTAPSLSERVAVIVEQELASPRFGVAHVAAVLGMGERTLQRQLAQENLQFRQIVLDVRQRLARSWLEHTAWSSKEVGERLGFSSERAFRRAFQAWTGLTPAGWRAR